MNRETFKQNAKKSIDEFYDTMNKLHEKANKAEGVTKAKYEEIAADLKIKKKDLQAKYDALGNTTEEKWDEVKKAFSSASDSFKEGLNKIKDLFK